MEQQEPRRDFVKALHDFCQQVELNDLFIKELNNHSNHEYIEEVMKFDDHMARKAFIFLEFTRERSTCNQMVDILLKCGQNYAANMLQSYNTSPPFMLLSYEINVPINPAIVPRSGGTKYFTMSKKPIGKCIIINNVKDMLGKESLRFQNIFEQLSFNVELWYNLSASDMKNKLIEVSTDKKLTDGDALIVMTISHGHDEKIVGVDGSQIRIAKIIDIFAKILVTKPKLFFFNCCRIKEEMKVMVTENPDEDEIVIVLKNPAQKWVNNHKKTMVSYACAQGYESWFIPGQFTHFGQALSHCIAQYACDNDLKSIMTLTSQRYKEFGSAETRYFELDRKIYFNPGLTVDEVYMCRGHPHLRVLASTRKIWSGCRRVRV